MAAADVTFDSHISYLLVIFGQPNVNLRIFYALRSEVSRSRLVARMIVMNFSSDMHYFKCFPWIELQHNTTVLVSMTEDNQNARAY